MFNCKCYYLIPVVQYEPLVVESWALPTIKKVKDILIKSITNLPR